MVSRNHKIESNKDTKMQKEVTIQYIGIEYTYTNKTTKVTLQNNFKPGKKQR